MLMAAKDYRIHSRTNEYQYSIFVGLIVGFKGLNDTKQTDLLSQFRQLLARVAKALFKYSGIPIAPYSELQGVFTISDVASAYTQWQRTRMETGALHFNATFAPLPELVAFGYFVGCLITSHFL